jgi:hypothetical protein
MMTERPAIFEGDDTFMLLNPEHADEVCEFFRSKRIAFHRQSGPGRTVRIGVISLGASEVERLMMELTRAVF